MLRKGAIIRRGRPIGLAPQKVLNVDNVDALKDTYQRKVFFDGKNFFVFLFDDTAKQLQYTSSSKGKSWSTPSNLRSIAAGPYPGGNADVSYPNKGAKDTSELSVDVALHICYDSGSIGYSRWMPYVISGSTLVARGGAALGMSLNIQGGRLVSSLDGTRDYMVYHRASPDRVGIQISPATDGGNYATDVAFGSTTTGGAVLLPYKSSSPFNMLILMKDSSDILYWNVINAVGLTFANASSTVIATLTTSFSDFCACSEVQNVGDPERVHMVYIKSTGELCYRKFENDALSDELVLVASGASYPVIAAGKGGRLYVFYAKDGVIKSLKYGGISWSTEKTLFPEHSYNNPSYLSCNQNVQSGKICLVWTEGTATPYEVWFCYLED